MQRLKYLDGLKGLGCIMVFVSHLKMFGFTHDYELLSMFNEVFFGDMFVNIFLAASAYGIAASIQSNLQRGNGLKLLILKRYFRLAIPIAMALIITAIFYYGGLFANQKAIAYGGKPLLADFYASVSIAGLIKAIFLSPFGITNGWLTQAWMLKYIFYGTFMTIALVLGTEGMKPWKTYLICVFFAYLFYYIEARMMFIVLGFMLYVYLQNKKENKYDNWIAIIFFLLYFSLRAATFYFHFHRHGNVSYSLALFLWIAVAHSSAIQRFFSSNVMTWLGKISMSVYLLHFTLVVSLSSWLFILLEGINPFVASVIILIVTSAVLLLVSWLSQKYIEEKISNTIIKKILLFLEK